MNETRNQNITDAIRELKKELETYRQAVQDAKCALDDAEKELSEILHEINPNQD